MWFVSVMYQNEVFFLMCVVAVEVRGCDVVGLCDLFNVLVVWLW